jgi:lipooligosaccharide transport system permease protein
MFAGIAMCFTSISPGIDTLNYPSFLFITPMALFSGTFFPLTLMPVFLQYIAFALLPLTHLVAIMRMFTLPSLSWMILVHLAWIAIITAVFCLLSINLMRRRLIV